MIIRLAILFLETKHLNISQVVLSIVIDFASLYFQLQKEVETRQNFKVFYDYTQARTQFEHVLKKHLPQSLAIFNQEINDILFFNRSFSKSFPYDNLNFTALDILASFMVSHDPFTAGSVNLKKFSKTNLLDYLKKITKHDVLTEETISTFAIFQDKLYEVKIFQVTWDRAPAIALIMNDISEYEDSISLKVANVSKDKVIATISHELRTPLNAILGILQILKKGISDQTYLNYISLCKNNCILLLSMIQSFLDLHSARKNRLRFKVHQVEVRMLLHDVLNTFEYMCIKKGIELALDIDYHVPEFISTDKDRLFQVFTNIVGNAIKFTQEGKITIGARLDPDRENAVLFWIQDTGKGILEADRLSLFEMYDRYEHAQAVNTKGAGVGLTISNIIVKYLNGEDVGIHVDSEVGKGSLFSFSITGTLSKFDRRKKTTLRSSNMYESKVFNEEVDIENAFKDYALMNVIEPASSLRPARNQRSLTFYLPGNLSAIADSSSQLLLKEPSYKKMEKKHRVRSQTVKVSLDDYSPISTAQPMEDRHASYEKSGIKWVMVVDDNLFNIMVARHFLEARNFGVKTALHGEEAIQVIQEHIKMGLQPFEIILMDCQMPIMDGFECTRRLIKMMRSQELPKIPIYALTANDTEDDKKKCLACGMDGVISKPLKEEDLTRFLGKDEN